jgi:hypothetical protein
MRLMFHSALRIVSLACLASASSVAWAAPFSIVEAASAPVRVAAPAEGMILAGGSLAVLEWTPLDAYDPLQAQEWEAFLSLDGGAHYPLRITPHLDSDLRRILWQVPATPTRNGRLLLRFGNERAETSFEVPVRFEISAPTVAHLKANADVATSVRGEPARAGDPGVVAWVEGSRRGGSLRQMVALPSGLVPAAPPAELLRGESAIASDPDPDPAPSGRSVLQHRLAFGGHGERKPAVPLVHRSSVPILLLIARQNE